MSKNEAKIACERRTVVGSRSARKLRYEGRMVGCIQSTGGQPNVDLHFDAREFETARRGHVHLFDLDFGGTVQSAVVNSLQWDALGDTLVHVEFRPVERGVAIDSKVEIHFVGTAAGILQHILDEVMIRCIPSKIPDFVVAKVEGLEEGTHIRAKDLIMPEGVTLAIDPETEIAVLSGIKVEIAPPPAEGEAPAAPAAP
jgi:large subunit ribosomal protein L25